jgi:excisionase family DNA binding protein
MGDGADRLAYSVAEAASALGISRSYCYELVQQGVLPYLQLGCRKVIPRRSLEEYIKGQTRQHGSEVEGAE